ncbi:MAG TPA: hypothetical protein VLV88_14040 [Terriglobales bacterium]|nr:hypothetical protein [Terriglobales bacterium]
MKRKSSAMSARWRALGFVCALILPFAILLGSFGASADEDFSSRDFHFFPGNLVVSRSVYHNDPKNVQIGTILPPGCANTQGGCSAASGAPYDGTYPSVWNNDIYDASFGITSTIFLDQLTPFGSYINSLEVPNSLERHVADSNDQLVTSFSSKSELALHLSTSGRYLTFMGYIAPVDTIDTSNSNTPSANDPTDPVGESFYRGVAQVDSDGDFHFTETNAYSGNNGRAAILNDANGAKVFYLAGNAGNGSNPQPTGIIIGAGAQILTLSRLPESAQAPGDPTPVASFSVTQLGAKADKLGKDDNFRGITIFNNVLYYTKGSGSNGVNTVYFVDTTGTACPNGVGLPVPGAILPTAGLSFDPNSADFQKNGLPNNMCILSGFPSTPNKSATTTSAPFGIWFASANTIYVADEGDGFTSDNTLYTHAAAQTTAGLQKWVFDSTSGTWNLAYTLRNGLELGTPYTIRDYPTGNNPATGLPWAPATDGLRNITGQVDRFGHALIWAITSTVSGNGDPGADPNKLVFITDSLANTDPSVAAYERFWTLRVARFDEVLRGVAFTPGTDFDGRRR